MTTDHLRTWASDGHLLAWLAGFTDGEGSIFLSTQRPKNAPPYIKPSFSVVNTIEAPIKRAKDIVSEVIGRELRYVVNRQSGVGYRPLFCLKADRQPDIRAICVALLPYLSAKRLQAEKMIEYLDIAPGRGASRRGTSYTERHYEYVTWFKHANRRYAKGEWLSSQRETERLAPLGDEETIRPASQDAEALGN